MLVSTAMLSLIVLGLTAMLIQTQKAFKTGIKQTSVTDAGRSICDMIALDFSQMSDPHFTNVYFPAAYAYSPTLDWALVPNLGFNQGYSNNGSFVFVRSNQVEDIFLTVQTNATWVGIGYTVSNWFTNASGGYIPGVCSLYRYSSTTNAPLNSTNFLFPQFENALMAGTFTNTFFHRIADGVVHLKITAFDADGNETYYEPYYDQNGTVFNTSFRHMQYPVIIPNPTNSFMSPFTNYLPHSVDIELGVLEPDALEHARALFTSGATAAAQQYLQNAANQVEIFREHVIIPAAP
jgi:hypothetical protein